MKFSVVIPARDEESLIGRCLESIRAAAEPYPGEVEIVVVANRCRDRTEEIARSHGVVVVRHQGKCLAAIRNAGVAASRGEIIATIDADSVAKPNLLTEIDKALQSGKYIGGGVPVIAERFSLGILMSGLAIMLYLASRGLRSAGVFWCYRRDFDAVGGFDESVLMAEDVDFACRLKAYGKKQGKRFGTLSKSPIRTSCRKFDRFGDWFVFRQPSLIKKMVKGQDAETANRYWYDTER